MYFEEVSVWKGLGSTFFWAKMLKIVAFIINVFQQNNSCEHAPRKETNKTTLVFQQHFPIQSCVVLAHLISMRKAMGVNHDTPTSFISTMSKQRPVSSRSCWTNTSLLSLEVILVISKMQIRKFESNLSHKLCNILKKVWCVMYLSISALLIHLREKIMV